MWALFYAYRNVQACEQQNQLAVCMPPISEQVCVTNGAFNTSETSQYYYNSTVADPAIGGPGGRLPLGLGFCAFTV